MTTWTYSLFVTTLANGLVVDSTDPNFTTQLPLIITQAEKRCYRDLDLISTTVRDHSGSFTAGNRNLDIATTIIIADELNVITPAGTTDPEAGTRNQLVPCSDELLNMLYPSSSGSALPQYFAMIDQDSIIVGPWPDQNYTIEVVGMQRPTELSATNTTTLLTSYFFDLFFAAAMCAGAAYLKNNDSVADDPKMAITWENTYNNLLSSAKTEEARKQFTSQGWSDKSPVPATTKPRT